MTFKIDLYISNGSDFRPLQRGGGAQIVRPLDIMHLSFLT